MKYHRMASIDAAALHVTRENIQEVISMVRRIHNGALVTCAPDGLTIYAFNFTKVVRARWGQILVCESRDRIFAMGEEAFRETYKAKGSEPNE